MLGSELKVLVGRTIKSIESRETESKTMKYVIVLDNGEEYEIETHSGCDVCDNGWSKIIGLETLPLENVVTNVEVKADAKDDDLYEIFVFFHNDKFDVKVDDGYGNGMYGGGFKLTINGKETAC